MDKEKIKNILIKKMPENQVFIDEPMSKHTSFKNKKYRSTYLCDKYC